MKEFIIKSISSFVIKSIHNKVSTTDIPYFEPPLLKFADANDKLF